MSKITVANVRAQVGELLEYSLETKKRNFLVSIPSPGGVATFFESRKPQDLRNVNRHHNR